MIKLFKPYDICDEKIRLGPNEDGGYVTSAVTLEQSVALFTYGVGHDIRYEEAYRDRYDKPVYLYDHTIGRSTGWDIGRSLNFYNEGLGYKENCEDFINHYEKLEIKGKVLLKVDIEGDEYDYFERVDVNKLRKITTGILVEMHWLYDSNYQKKAESVLHKLYDYYTLTHVHGNSWGITWNYEGHEIPETLELSLVNNDIITHKQFDTRDYPIEGLDVSNRPNHPDIELKFLKYV